MITLECDADAAPIRIGGLGPMRSFVGMEDGIRAIVEKANRTCIGGRKLDFVGVRDDGGDPTRNLELARSLVEDDHVFAIIATSEALLPATTDYLTSRKIPFFGWGFMPGFCGKDAWGYGFNGCVSAFDLGLSQRTDGSLVEPIAALLHKDVDTMSVAIFRSDSASGSYADAQLSAMFAKSQVVAKIPVPVQYNGDYAPYVSVVKEKHPDAVMIASDFTTVLRVRAAIAQTGYDGVVYDSVTYDPGFLESSPGAAAAMEHGFIVTQIPAAEDNSIAIGQLTSDLRSSGSTLPIITEGASLGYWSTDLLRQMLLATAAKGQVTIDNFRKTVEGAFESVAIEGGPGAIRFPSGHVQNVPCAGVVQVSGGKYKSVTPFACYDLRPAKST